MGPFRSLGSTYSLRILLPVGLAGAALLGWSWWKEATLIRRAEEMSAEILESSVESYTTGTGSNRERNWRPVVKYRYEVGETNPAAKSLNRRPGWQSS